MKRTLFISVLALTLLASCNKDEKILNTLNEYNTSMEDKGYHFGDALQLPADVLNNAEKVTINFGEKETDKMVVDPAYFTLGTNAVTFVITKSNGETISQDANINVYSKTPEAKIQYEIVKEYPHDPKSFTQGFQYVDNMILESDGQYGTSRLWKYSLGSTTPTQSVDQAADIFAEGATVVGDKIYQLTYQNKKGFVYDKNSLKLLSEFPYSNMIAEGWGLTFDGKQLIFSDGTKFLYFLNPNDPSKVVRQIGVASDKKGYDQLNELEYHNGFVYANVWQQPIILKIDPKTGEVVGSFDFTEIAKKHTKGMDDVLNGIAFKGDNMLITGKMWPTIYEVQFK